MIPVGFPLSGSHHQWIRNTIERSRLQEIWAEWFESYDVLLFRRDGKSEVYARH